MLQPKQCLIIASLIVAAIGATAGCGGGIQLMRAASSTTLAATPGKALIVFIGSRRIETGVKNVLWLADARGQYLGMMEHDTWQTVELEPGEHMLFGWFASGPRIDRARFPAEAGGMLQLDVEAGRTYFVRVTAAPNMGFVPNAVLIPLTPENPDWAERERWLARRDRMEPIAQNGQAFFEQPENASLIRQRIAMLMDIFQRLSPRDRARHMIAQNDGL